MRRIESSWRRALPARVLASIVGLAALSACRSSPASSVHDSPIQAPLDTVVPVPGGTWALLGMGILTDQSNTFWQALYRPLGSSHWTVRTPPGVADNGGLILAASAAQVVIGFRPSADLEYSPLAISTDQGTSYTPGLLPEGLADAPDALSLSSGGSAVALSAQTVLTSRSNVSGWSPLTSLAVIAASAAGTACGVEQLTAVVATSSAQVVGTMCRHTRTPGILTVSGSTIEASGPTLPGVGPNSEIDVLSLVPYHEGLAALLRIGAPREPVYQVIWQTQLDGAWRIGPTLAAGTPKAVSFAPSGGLVLLSSNATGELSASTVSPGARAWTALPAPPPGTAAISMDSTGTDALSVNGQIFTDYHLTGAGWMTAQAIDIPLAYGSSN